MKREKPVKRLYYKNTVIFVEKSGEYRLPAYISSRRYKTYEGARKAVDRYVEKHPPLPEPKLRKPRTRREDLIHWR